MALRQVARICLAVGMLSGFSEALGQTPVVSFNSSDGGVLLAKTGHPVQICVDAADWKGVIRAAQDLADDFGRVTGTNGTLTKLGGSNATAAEPDVSDCGIIVGTIGKSPLVDDLASSGSIDVSDVEGEWEAFRSEVIQQDNEDGGALVVAGSDKRGAIYGIYDISEQIGVSPWYYWADVAPHHHEEIYALTGAPKTQPSPSVRYRGIFINDEAPALTNYIRNNFEDVEYGLGFNHIFYGTVFELLLRLRANYLWPAMWGSMFNYDDPLNQPLADEYGIVMGTSHTEPLACATKEWGNFGDGDWDWRTNEENVRPFLEECAARAAPYDTLYTIGMRGYDDTALSPDTEIELLEEIVAAQREILEEANNGSTVPQVWTLYEEVMDYYTQGMQVEDDVVLLWADDNWGNIRRLPMANETDRVGGAGVYYHFDLVGDPRAHKWMNTIQLERTLEQMVQAYDRDARALWVVNVGDIKPLEIPTTHFLDLAYDIDIWRAPDSTLRWLEQWATREFGSEVAPEAAQIAHEYSLLASRRVYEAMEGDVYSIIDYEEAELVLTHWKTLGDQAQALHDALDQDRQPAFFQLVLHPILAGGTVYDIHISADLNRLYAEQGRNAANEKAQHVQDMFEKDDELMEAYNSLLDWKWNGMMDQTHLGYTYWQQPMRQFTPPVSYVHPRQTALFGNLGVAVEGSKARVPGDSRFHDLNSNTLDLVALDPYGRQTYFEVFGTGTERVRWNVTTEPFVQLTQSEGVLCPGCEDTGDVKVYVSIDWDLVPSSYGQTLLNFSVEHDGGNGTRPSQHSSAPSLQLSYNKTEVADDFTAGFVESDRHISIEAEHYTRLTPGAGGGNSTSYTRLPHFGRTHGAMSLSDHLGGRLTIDSAPTLEYDFYKFSEGEEEFNVTMILGNGLNNHPGEPLTYAVQFDDRGEPLEVAYIGEAPPGRGARPAGWHQAVFDAAWVNTTTWDEPLEPGEHTLKVWLLQPGTVLTKILLDFGGQRPSYLGPPESTYLS